MQNVLKFKYTLLLALSIVFFFFLSQTDAVQALLRSFWQLGLWGAFVAGVFFVSTFTVVPATYLLYHLAENLGALPVAVVAGLGAVMGDLMIFKFLKDAVFEELAPVFKRWVGKGLSDLLHRPLWRWLEIILGAIIIASPFPDELGIGLMGISRISNWGFAILAYFLNSTGIYILVQALTR